MSETKPTREHRILELKVIGFTAENISNKLKEEGYRHVSVRTVAGYLAKVKFTDPAPAFKEELMRRQLMDISLIDDPESRCKVRQPIIDKFYSSKQQVEGDMKIRVVMDGLGTKQPRTGDNPPN